jgi:hypothetical protein
MSDRIPSKKRFENPAVLAASVASLTTFCIGVVTAGSAWWTAHVNSIAEVERTKIQAKVDDDKSQRDTRRQLIISAFEKEPSAAKRLDAYIAAGVLDDPDCKLRIALLDYSSDCKPRP